MKVGVSTWSLLNTEINAAVKKIGDAGFDYIEVWGEVPHAYHDWTDRKRLKDTLSAYSMTVTLHAPFTDLNIGSPFQPVKSAVAKTLEDFVEFGVGLRASMITFHPGSVYNQALVHDSVGSAAGTLNRMVKASQGRLTICIENQARSTSKYEFPNASTIQSLERMLSEVDGSRFTLDTGHANVSRIDPLALARRLGPNLKEVHLSDNSGDRDDHLIPGEGNARLARLVDKLSGTDVLLCLELNPHKYSPNKVISAALEVKERASRRHLGRGR